MRKLFTALLVLACIAMLIMTSLPDSGKSTENTSQSFSIEASTTPLTVSSMPTEEEKPEQTKPFFPNEEAFLDYLEKTQTDAGFTAVAYEDFCKTGLGHLAHTFPVLDLKKYSDNIYYYIDKNNPQHYFLTQILYNYDLKLAIIMEQDIPIQNLNTEILSSYSTVNAESPHVTWANFEYDYTYYLSDAGYNSIYFVVHSTLYCVDNLGEKHCKALTEGILRNIEYDENWNAVEKESYLTAYYKRPTLIRTGQYSDYKYEVYSDDTVRITEYLGYNSSLTIPSMIDGLPVTSIGKTWIKDTYGTMQEHGAFEKLSFLTSVNIPEGIVTIEDYAFYLCSNLKMVNIPSTVNLIGTCAFSGCSSLTDIYFEGSAPEFGKGALATDFYTNIHFSKKYSVPWAYFYQDYPYKFAY